MNGKDEHFSLFQCNYFNDCKVTRGYITVNRKFSAAEKVLNFWWLKSFRQQRRRNMYKKLFQLLTIASSQQGFMRLRI
jgi:hypothetical protein